MIQRTQILIRTMLAIASLLMAFAVAAQTNSVPAVAQDRPSDAEMKEVLRLLLELEIPRSSSGDEVVVLLGPNVKSDWIPQMPGISIRQLTYQEQRQVSEYYDLSVSYKDAGLSSQANAIDIVLMKGNYCRKAGRRYEFQRQAGMWHHKEMGYAESTTFGSCEGCVVGSGAIYSVRNRFPSTDSDKPIDRKDSNSLVLNGEVGEISCYKDKTKFVQCKATLKLKFTNRGAEPLIILQPNGEYEFWHGGTSLALSEKDSRANSFVYDSSAWPSIDLSTQYRSLADLLDKPNPPDGVTRILDPNGSWLWETSIKFSFYECNSCNQHVGVEIGWKEIQKLSTPLWLRVSYEMWPFNVENFKRNLGGVLKKRWQKHGSLYLDGKFERYWEGQVTSEPIELPLNKIETVHNGFGPASPF